MYRTIAQAPADAKAIVEEEVARENALIDMLDGERLKHTGAAYLVGVFLLVLPYLVFTWLPLCWGRR
jgi:VIT1/CCC1 family predicted Fe2+/Mn2+ transporter